jgi:hypothetical protein
MDCSNTSAFPVAFDLRAKGQNLHPAKATAEGFLALRSRIAVPVIRMNYGSRKIVILANAGVGLLVARAALPIVLTWLANLGLRKVPGYRGKAQRVDFHFADPSLVVQGLSFAKSTGTRTEQLLNISSVIVGSHWKMIFTGALVGYVQVDAPRLQLNLQSFQRDGAPWANHDRNPKADPNQQPWQEIVKQLPAFRLTQPF